MSAPLKPWEMNINNTSSGFSNNILQSSNSSQIGQNVIQTPVGRLRMTPPVPPRPNNTNSSGVSYNSPYNNYNSYGTYNRGYGYSPYPSFSSYGGYGSYMGGYGNYGGYGSPYNTYGGPGYGFGPESSFIRLAEESTRPAFQSIESVVRAFSGISMMMDSTFFAITSSFRAVLGIADNIGQLRSMFGQIWSSFALFRLLNWIYRKVMGLIGIKVGVEGGNKAWQQAQNGQLDQIGIGNAKSQNNWPIFLFLGIILSAPYLISKMIPNVDENENSSNKWPSPGIPVNVLYDFQASNPQELSVAQGERILVAPKLVQEKMGLMATGWIYASKNNNQVGIVPKNYLEPPTNNKIKTNKSNPNNLTANLEKNNFDMEQSQVPENNGNSNEKNT